MRERSAVRQEDDFFYYTRYEEEKQYAVHCRRYESMENEEQVVLDENAEAEGEDYFCLGALELSPDHNQVMYGVDTEGNERFTLRFRNLVTNQPLEDELYDCSWTARWAADNRTVLYTRVDQSGRSYQVLRHRLGHNATDGSDDEVVYTEPDERFFLRLTVSNSWRYFLLNVDGQITKEVLFLSTATPEGTFRPVQPRRPGVLYQVSHHGQHFYVLTNQDGACNFKVMRVHVDRVDSLDEWEELLAHRDDVLLERIDLFRHHFVVWEWHGGLQRIRIQDLSDGEVHYVAFSEPLYAVWPGEKPDTEDTLEAPYFNSNTFTFSYSSLVQPVIVYDYDMDNHRRRKKKEQVVHGYVREEYHQKRLWAPAEDGALVPISLVYKISLKNPSGNPLLLTAYGAYGGHKLPSFDADRLSLLDRGVIFAIAHVRGDATLGWQWYEQGKFLQKKNTFTDFIACARYLIQEGYTTPERLAIHGRSAGGLLIGAVVNLAPELFKCVVADVPFLDAIGSMIDSSVPWTAFEWDEWGDPRKPEFFHYILSYSPYANLEAKAYPHMLITTGLNDPRVCYWEPAKYTAKLRRLKTNQTTLLLKTYLAGHMGASGRFDALSERAFAYAFIIDKLGLLPAVQAKAGPLLRVVSPVALTPPELVAMFQGYQVTMALHAALDLGLFDRLHQLPNFQATAGQLAQLLDVSHVGLHRLLMALVAVGLLHKEGDLFTMTELAASHLVQGMPAYIGDVRFTLANELLWNAVRRLPEALRCGRPSEELPRHALSLEAARSSQCAYRHAALALLQALGTWETRKKTLLVLDFGAGNGLLGYTLAKHQRLSRQVRVTSFDRPEVLEIARRCARELELEERVTFLEGDVADPNADLGGPYDLIIVGQNVISSCADTPAAAATLERLSDALKSTGRVVLHETVAGLDQSPYAPLYSLAMFATRREGKINNIQWYKQLLAQTGFAPPTVYPLTPFPEKLLISSRNIISRHIGAKSRKDPYE